MERVEPVTFPYQQVVAAPGQAILRPIAPITLRRDSAVAQVMALVDSGSDVNVLPYDVGVSLGVRWEDARIPLNLGGRLNLEARALLVQGHLEPFLPVDLVFAWTRSNSTPVILGQTNFFAEFDVCFHQSRLQIQISPRPT